MDSLANQNSIQTVYRCTHCGIAYDTPEEAQKCTFPWTHPLDRIEAHICRNGSVRPYAPVLCSTCAFFANEYTPKGLSIRDMAHMLTKLMKESVGKPKNTPPSNEQSQKQPE